MFVFNSSLAHAENGLIREARSGSEDTHDKGWWANEGGN